MKTLFLIRGVPGCGKTTLAQLITQNFCVAADDYHIDIFGNYNWKPENSKAGHEWCKGVAEQWMLQERETVVVHNTFTQEWEMQPYFDLAEQYGYRVTTLIVENRHSSKSIHNVPTETIKKMTDRFDIKLAPDVDYKDFVQVKEQNGLFVHKYKRKVFYDNLWDIHPELVDARGLVTNVDGNIVQYPFTKIFNRNENGVDIDKNNTVVAVDKINGFMAAVTWYNGDVLVSTTGSLTSDFVEMAKEMLPLDKMVDSLKTFSSHTFCFEIVHPNDPHIIEEKVGAYLIGARQKKKGSEQWNNYTLDEFAKEWGVFRPAWSYFEFSDLLEKLKDYKREGFVVYDAISNTVLKLKSPYYLTSKFIARTKKLNLIFDNNFKQYFEEEYYSLCEFLQANYTKEQFLEIPEQTRLIIIRNWAESTINC
jgi:predicted kinase